MVTVVVAGGCSAGPTPTTPPSVPAGSGAAVPAPESVRVPAIGVDSVLVPLGIAADGSAEVPEDHAQAGWFTGGGRSAATVVLGHVDSRAGPAVFHRLRDLVPGDRVEVVRAGGIVTGYVVVRTEQVPKDTFPTFAVFGATADDVVRLVTCAGTFDRGARSYTDNLVVHAERA